MATPDSQISLGKAMPLGVLFPCQPSVLGVAGAESRNSIPAGELTAGLKKRKGKHGKPQDSLDASHFGDGFDGRVGPGADAPTHRSSIRSAGAFADRRPDGN